MTTAAVGAARAAAASRAASASAGGARAGGSAGSGPAPRPAPKPAPKPAPAPPSSSGPAFPRVQPVVFNSAGGFALGVLTWCWLVLPFLRGGMPEVRNVLRAKFFNKAADGTWLP